MKRYLKFISSIFLFQISFFVSAQVNSPWKTYASQVVDGVLAVPGSHKYSLTAGQGFAVYLKNQNAQPVTVTGLLTAKTTCGTAVSSRFTVSLLQGQALAGTNFDNVGTSGQTSVVTASDCDGIKFTKNASYINRISTVTVSELQVRLINTLEIAPPVTKPIFNEVKVPETPKNEPQFDSLNFYKSNWYRFKDSLYNELGQLKKANFELLDSLNKVKIAQTKQAIVIQKPKSNKLAFEEINEVTPFALSILGGIGYNRLPLIANYDTAVALYRFSFTDATTHPTVHLGLLATLFNNKLINLEVSPFASYGINFNNAQTGNHLSYGVDVNILAKVVPTLPLKLNLTANYTSRSGSWNKGLSSADYDYKLIKYGAGLRYVARNNTFWIQPGVYWDNPNKHISGATPSLVAAIDAEIASKWRINLSYGANYLNEGVKKYNTYIDGQQNYISIKIIGTMANFSL